MKGKIAVLLTAALLSVFLTACGKFTCDICGQEKSGKRYTVDLLGTGDEMTICEDCYKDLESFIGSED